MNEKELLRRLKSRDREAQKIFWELHRDPVYGFIYGRSRLRRARTVETMKGKVDDSDVQDILVSTFISFFKDIAAFQGKDATMKTWLYEIAKNRTIDFYRQEDRQNFGNPTSTQAPNQDEADDRHSYDSLSDAQNTSSATGPILPRTRLRAEQSARSWHLETSTDHKSDDSVQIQEALDQLSDEQERVVRLRFLQGYSIKETADILGISEGAVKMAALRGIKKMNGFLKDRNADVEGAPRS